MRKTSLAAVALLALSFATAGGAQAATLPATQAMPSAGPAAATGGPKVVIIVGPTEGATQAYRSYADAEYATVLKYTSNVVRIYSPDATWAAVQAAVKDANVVIYHGHGNGWPSPYPFDPNFTTRDGFGLNKVAGAGDANHTYYGEPYMRRLTFAPGALVLLHNLCYASGDSEPGNPQPTLSVAEQRADNYASAFLAAGASAVIADGHMGAGPYLDALFTQHETLFDLWRSMPDFHDHTIQYASTRTAAAVGELDPEQPDANYYRSITGNPGATTDDVLGGTVGSTLASYTSGPVARLSGGDRYATAAAISAATFKPGVSVAYIANGGNFPDALAGAPVAGLEAGPLLLVARDAIPAATAAELSRLKPARIVILGGAGVVSDSVAALLGASQG
jgi:hypothetical protein